MSLRTALLEARAWGAETNHIVFGLQCDAQGTPLDDYEHAFSVPRDILKEGHIHIRGRTRSGKTSLAIAPLIEQLIKPYSYCGPDGEVIVEQMKDPIFIFDLGGDLALFNFVKKRLCESKSRELDERGQRRNARKFRFLSLKEDDDWDYFDPFQIVHTGEKNIIRLAQVLIEAFNQDYGLLYGAAYYSMRSLSALIRVAEHVVKQSEAGQHLDFKAVGRYFQKPGNSDRDEAQIRMAFDFLMKYPQLQNPPPNAPHRRQIDMRRALDHSEVVYFFCPSMGQATTARQIAGLGLYTLLAAAQLRKDQGHNKGQGHRHAWVIVDEFHELAGRSFASLLAQSSKYGISLILANQTTTQLENRDVNLAHVVRDNCLAKMYFTVTGKQDFDDLQGFSEEDRDLLRSGSERHDVGSGYSLSEGFSERITTKLKRDEILATSASGKQFYMVLDDGAGHREPLRLVSDYTLDGKDYLDLKNEPVPVRESQAGVDPIPKHLQIKATAHTVAQTESKPTNNTSASHSQALLQLLEKKRLQEQPAYVQKFYRIQNVGTRSSEYSH